MDCFSEKDTRKLKTWIREIDQMERGGKYVCGYGHMARQIYKCEIARRVKPKKNKNNTPL